jgi:hypothetical protein
LFWSDLRGCFYRSLAESLGRDPVGMNVYVPHPNDSAFPF